MISIIEKLKYKIKKSLLNYYSNRDYCHCFNESYRQAAVFLKSHPQPPLTENEKQEIDIYWAQYGIKLPDYSWHEMYYGVTGIHSPKFIPDPFVGYAIIPFYNTPNYIDGWVDKNFFDRILPNVSQPDTLCHKFNGDFYDEKWNLYDEKRLQAFAAHIYERMLNNNDTCFVLKYLRIVQVRVIITLPTDYADLFYCFNLLN